MTDPEREHFARQVADLEGRLRRWQLISFVLAALLLVPVVGIGLAGAFLVPRMARQRDALMELERARMEALEAEMRARQAAEEAARQRDEAEKARQEARKDRRGDAAAP
jgi:hypothetical protein